MTEEERNNILATYNANTADFISRITGCEIGFSILCSIQNGNICMHLTTNSNVPEEARRKFTEEVAHAYLRMVNTSSEPDDVPEDEPSDEQLLN